MEVTYTLTAKHYAQFQQFWYRKKARIKPWMWAIALVVLLCLLIAVQSRPLMAVFIGPFIFVPGLIALLNIIMPFYVPLIASRQAKNTFGFLGLHTMRIGPEGLMYTSDCTRTLQQWGCVRTIDEDAQMVYFFLTPRYAVLLSKDAFATPAQAQRFTDAARFFWQHPGETLPPSLAAEETWPPPPSMLQSF